MREKLGFGWVCNILAIREIPYHGAHVEVGLILVDAPTTNSYISKQQGSEEKVSSELQTRLLHSGYQNILFKPLLQNDNDFERIPSRSSPLESLIYYWSLQLPPGFKVQCPTLFGLSYYALRIDVAEWMAYLELLYHCIQHYEYSPKDVLASFGQIEMLTANIPDLQRWARRSISTARKIHFVMGFLRYCLTKEEDPEPSTQIYEDYQYISLTLDAYSHRLDAMVSAATSLIQAIDCRRSLAETLNMSRLTYLALTFLPLTFVSGLFSMNDRLASVEKLFGLYFGISIPLCVLVFLFAHPPKDSLNNFAAWLYGSKRKQVSKV